MNLFKRTHTLALITLYALFPPRKKSGVPSGTTALYSHYEPLGVLTLRPADIPGCLADLDRAVDSRGELHLFFPDCPALAAPLLLFRLKRTGFSGCRARVTRGGVELFARR